ncbi:hypothetical protein IQ13_4243 [Lacibacter cauensis]|uniref:Uncharacterized protein n=1 Tax=Lacibacter cauensis TaxID=510947 RepID=A0A562S9L9_9BACT|nr:hypothetical protein [Lacibacter cauensis]TWI77999.1 hypothetical protein IQ13_4243 [Lacibacter cauensis]
MHLENLTSLSSQLDLIGFKNMTACLAKRICLLPACFTITKSVSINNDELFFHFHFKSEPEVPVYCLDYFDAGFKKYVPLDGLTINDIKLDELDRLMKTIDWKIVFDFSEASPTEQDRILSVSAQVEKIMQQFVQLNQTEEGQQQVILLKQKYWSVIPYHALMGTVTSPKATNEIIQRFYCTDQQASVTIQDVYRFLQFKRIEKEMRVKGKPQIVSRLHTSHGSEKINRKKSNTVKSESKTNETRKTN